MSRALLVLGAIAAVVCGVWGHAARAPISVSADAPLPAERAEAVASELESSPAPPAQSPMPAVATEGPQPAGRSPGGVPSPAEPQAFVAALKIAADGQPAAPERVYTIEEMQDLARREAEGLVTIRNADGSETLNHEGRFTDYTVVRIGKDGKPVFTCVHGEAGLEHAMHSPATVTPKED